MAWPLLGHLDPSFLAIMDRVQSMLREVFETSNALTIAVSGTGSAAMEAAIANTVEPGSRVLVCINGYFGHRIAEMARRQGGEVATLECRWGEAFSTDEIAASLERRSADVVAIVHAETSTGVLQPLDGIPEIVHKYGAMIVVDAVTSLGGVGVRVDHRAIDVCYAASQKCIGAPPGLGPITLSPGAVHRLGNRQSPPAVWYLDLSLLQEYWGGVRNYHHTPPISTIYALHEALREVLDEGLEARWSRHRANAELLWDELEALGLSPYVERSVRLPCLTTVRVPDGTDEAAVRVRLRDEFGIEIGGGLGDLQGRVWRIGLMGSSSRPEYVRLLVAALSACLGRSAR